MLLWREIKEMGTARLGNLGIGPKVSVMDKEEEKLEVWLSLRFFFCIWFKGGLFLTAHNNQLLSPAAFLLPLLVASSWRREDSVKDWWTKDMQRDLVELWKFTLHSGEYHGQGNSPWNMKMEFLLKSRELNNEIMFLLRLRAIYCE